MKILTERYELTPTNGRKSFYGKAMVCVYSDGTRVLKSYETPIIERTADGTLHRLYNGWSPTTGTHIKSFCGLNKAEFFKLPYEPTAESDAITKANAYSGTLYR